MQCEKNLICRAAFENGGGHEPRDVSILQKLKKARKTDPPPPFPNSGAAETTAKQPQRQTPLLPAWDQGGLLSHRRTVPQTGAKGNSLETSVEAEVRSPEVGGELG